MITLTVVIIIFLMAIIFVSLYIIGIFNNTAAGHADLMLSAISDIKMNKRNFQQLPKKIVKLLLVLRYRRKLFVRKLKAKRLFRKAAKAKPAP